LKTILIGLVLISCIATGVTLTPSVGTTTQLVHSYFPIATNQVSSYWKPVPGTSWQIQFSGVLNISLDVQLYDVDLFDTPQKIIDQLHGQGRRVVCYFSAGSWEDWRPDADQFPVEVLGDDLPDWPGEKWLDVRRLDILGPIMDARLDLAKQKGCDGVDPDNVDGYVNESGFPLTSDDQLAYNIWIAEQAHTRDLAVGLKNDLEQITALATYFDWAINEQCFQYNECDLLLPFVQAGKPVFGIEYQGEPTSFCPQANAMNYDFLKKNIELDEWRIACR
jgi:hypothetical protein